MTLSESMLYNVVYNVVYNDVYNVVYNVWYNVVHNVVYNVVYSVACNVVYNDVCNVVFNVVSNVVYNSRRSRPLQIRVNGSLSSTDRFLQRIAFSIGQFLPHHPFKYDVDMPGSII